MPNDFLKAEKIIEQALGLLRDDIVLPRLVQRLGVGDFKGAKDDTINIRIPSVLKGREYEWRTRNQKIVVDDLSETVIDIKLDKHVYNAVGVTDEELTLDIDNWGYQVARPQIEAVAYMLEGYIAKAMESDAKYAHTVTYEPDPDNDNDRSFQRAANAANKWLNLENVPNSGRKILLGANVEEAALNSGTLQDVDRSGSDDALRRAVIGRIAGFEVIGNCNSIDPDFAVAFHPTAFVLGNVAPVVPDGAKAGAQMDYAGLALRWIRDYDSDYLRDRSVYSSFAGASSVEDGRVFDTESEDFGELREENVRAVEIAFTAGS
ncbi:MAG TPA: P22 phage major capsid protein family protein [Solirubrobacterales bacterium]|nr:P22 phage major capsid protein family protein [Solirubrobacterales bacterium]